MSNGAAIEEFLKSLDENDIERLRETVQTPAARPFHLPLLPTFVWVACGGGICGLLVILIGWQAVGISTQRQWFGVFAFGLALLLECMCGLYAQGWPRPVRARRISVIYLALCGVAIALLKWASGC